MARKRLLTILAAAVAAIGLQVGAATALDLDTDVAGVKVEVSVSDEGIEAKVGAEGDEDGELEAKVSEDGVDVKVGDEELSTSDGDADEAEDEDADEGDAAEEDGDAPKETSVDTREVTAAGADDAEPVADAHERPDALDPEQARQFLPGASDGVELPTSRADITPSFDLSGRQDIDEPVIAAPPERPDDATADWEPVEPPVTERSDAELAAIPAGDGNAVPAGLKLLAGLLVAGTGTLWHVARRELGTPGTVQTG